VDDRARGWTTSSAGVGTSCLRPSSAVSPSRQSASMSPTLGRGPGLERPPLPGGEAPFAWFLV